MFCPATIEELLAEGGECLKIKAVAIRNESKARIQNRKLIKHGMVLYLTTAEEEEQFQFARKDTAYDCSCKEGV